MERIQSALAKARATRDGRPQERPRPAATEKPTPTTEAAHAAWGEVPKAELKPKRLRKNRVIAFEDSEMSSQFDRLRTRTLQRMQAQGWKRLVIVSPGPRNGKSTVALNLAFSMARQNHLTAMLLELDMRRPRLANMLGLSKALDFSQVLKGEGAFTDHAVRLRENLIVAPTQAMRSGTSELLQAPDALSGLDQLSKTYDPSVTLFDMPPLGASDDALGFLSNADCALIVAAAGDTRLDEIDTCEREVAERTEVLGVVLNKCRYERASGSYGYY